ncbi:MAG: phage baseplate assembly protein V, partial [Nitrospirota bacterium]|nr:phage baseplate assembly protein V [Nitrospirota bacterium]
ETKHVDQFGRVRIRFPWRNPSHSTQTDPGDSGFVRVAQIATGVGSAALWLPDIGDEVAIAFEHGDPNRPVIIGSLYNGKDMPPVGLPANKHLSLLRAQSSSGQKAEIIFDATAGHERLVLESGAQMLTLGTSGLTMAGSSVALSSGTSLQLQAGADLVQQVGRNMVVEAGKDMLLKAGQNFALTSQRNAQFTVGDNAVIVTGKSLTTQSGAMLKFVAADTGTIQVGQGLLTIQRDGNIEIAGSNIAVKSSGNLVMKGSKITQN